MSQRDNVVGDSMASFSNDASKQAAAASNNYNSMVQNNRDGFTDHSRKDKREAWKQKNDAVTTSAAAYDAAKAFGRK